MKRLIGGTAALAVVMAAAPMTSASAQPAATPPPPLVVPVTNLVGVEWPAQPIAGVQDMHFSSANTDGSATETEDGQSRTYVLKADVMFAYNKATLTAKAKSTLTEIAKRIAATKPPQLTVVGHTDSDGSDAHNRKLSKQRAQAVAAFLASHLPATTKIKAAGKGETQPRASNANKSGRALNRRVEITAR